MKLTDEERDLILFETQMLILDNEDTIQSCTSNLEMKEYFINKGLLIQSIYSKIKEDR